MGLKTKKEAISSIMERTRTVNGATYRQYDSYIGVNCITKKQERLYASSRKELIEKIEEFYKARECAGDFSTYLTPEQIVDAKAAIAALNAAKMTISLSECAKREIERFSALMAHPTQIGVAFSEFLSTKREGGDKDKTVATTGRWAETLGADRILATIETRDIRDYLKTHYDAMAPKTYNSHLSYIRTFLNWCVKHDPSYLQENPAATIPLKEIEWKEPEYMMPDQVEKLFRALETEQKHPEYLALAISGFFCGVRRAESLRIAELDKAARFDLEDETVRIAMGKGYTKGRRPRAAQIEPNALAWMKSFDYISALKLVDDNTTQNLTRFALAHGVKMFHNCARHTFITMHVAKFGDPAKTQAMVGTSGTMLCNNYRGLASKRDGEAYFAIYPTRSNPDS